MSDNWQWWAGSNDEWYALGPFATRDEAIRSGRYDYDYLGGFHVLEALPTDNIRLSDWIPGVDRLLEDAEENLNDSTLRCLEYDDDTVFDASTEQVLELEKLLKETIHRWQDTHGLKFSVRTFREIRNKEYIQLSESV